MNPAVEVVFAQKKIDYHVHPVHFESIIMTSYERNFSTRERDALAVIFYLSKFWVCLISDLPFKGLTNHKSLQ